MKKVLVMLLSVIALASCSTNMKDQKMMKEETPVATEVTTETAEVMEENKFSFENSEVLNQSDKIVSNYHNKKGFKHSHVTLVMSPSLDVALFGIDGQEFELTRQKSASGIVYASTDGNIEISIHQGTLYVQMGSEKIEYFELGTDKLDFHKSSHHH